MSIGTDDVWLATQSDVERATEPTGWSRRTADMVEVVFATDGSAPVEARVWWTAARVRAFCDTVGGKAVFAFRLALFAVTWLAPVWSFKLPPVGRHDLATRAKIVDRFEDSPFGMSIFAIKAFLCMHYFEHPGVATDIKFRNQEER